ncbi:hypothetical protein WP8S17C03_17580 [Metapseudomonas otitidis]|uniref:UDP-glycosyltransferase n=1 Tax=Metapseudomonas otitidis TaxID=319939 RepID=A0A6S5RTC9_9GAMM|nr:hypothetical protein [Pseudomonas otitidis]BBT15709.1 hypothetical protein WP8S17C03_17580 [Pseudomonas otitidis]
MVKNRKILLVSYGGGHVAMLAPVAKALLENNYSVVFLALTTAGAYLDRLGMRHIGYKDLPGADSEEVIALGQMLVRDLPKSDSVSEVESVAYMGMNYRELVRLYGVDGAAQLYAQKGRQAFLPVEMFCSWFKEISPLAVLATNSPRSERAALEAASKLGIPSVCAVDLFGIQEIEWIKKADYASRICVLNDYVKEFFVDKGCLANSVVVTGNPAFERLQLSEVKHAGKIMRASKGWGANDIVVLWASQVEPEQHPFLSEKRGDPTLPGRIELSLRGLVAESKKFRLVIRRHPSESVGSNLLQERVEPSSPDEDLAVLLHAVDIVVVMSSTVGLQAHYAGCRVVSVAGSVFSEDAPYGRMGISTEVSSPDRLVGELMDVSPSDLRRSRSRDDFSGIENPTQNIVRTVESLIFI